MLKPQHVVVDTIDGQVITRATIEGGSFTKSQAIEFAAMRNRHQKVQPSTRFAVANLSYEVAS